MNPRTMVRHQMRHRNMFGAFAALGVGIFLLHPSTRHKHPLWSWTVNLIVFVILFGILQQTFQESSSNGIVLSCVVAVGLWLRARKPTETHVPSAHMPGDARQHDHHPPHRPV